MSLESEMPLPGSDNAKTFAFASTEAMKDPDIWAKECSNDTWAKVDVNSYVLGAPQKPMSKKRPNLRGAEEDRRQKQVHNVEDGGGLPDGLASSSSERPPDGDEEFPTATLWSAADLEPWKVVTSLEPTLPADPPPLLHREPVADDGGQRQHGGQRPVKFIPAPGDWAGEQLRHIKDKHNEREFRRKARRREEAAMRSSDLPDTEPPAPS